MMPIPHKAGQIVESRYGEEEEEWRVKSSMTLKLPWTAFLICE